MGGAGREAILVGGDVGLQFLDARVALLAIKRAGAADSVKIRDALATIRDLPGVGGPMTVDAAGRALDFKLAGYDHFGAA